MAASRLRSVSLRSALTVGICLLTATVLVGGIGSYVEHERMSDLRQTSRTELRPAQTAADQLATAYIDQETGQRGYLLTGDVHFLTPWTRGRATSARLTVRLRALLHSDARALRLLGDTTIAAGRWQHLSAEPEIAWRRKGTIAPATMLGLARRGQIFFDGLRNTLSALSDRVVALNVSLRHRYDVAQRASDRFTYVALLLAVLAAGLALAGIRLLVTGPLRRLESDVRAASTGAHEAPIRTRGPREVAAMAAAVEDMRNQIIRHGEELAAVQRKLSVRAERDRLAADLHDLTLQDVYALGLGLDGLADRHPELADDLGALIADTVRIDRELRAIVFAISAAPDASDLRAGVVQIVTDSRRALGFTPSLSFDGPLDDYADADTVPQLHAALREALSNVARHANASAATVSVDLVDGHLQLVVTDDGVGTSPDATPGNGVRNLSQRAERLGGYASVLARPMGGTIVEWCVPTTAARTTPARATKAMRAVG